MYTFSQILSGISFEQAVEKTRAGLAAKGFGVLTEIDVRKTMKAKLDINMDDYVILGACNPKMAYEAIKLEPQVGAMLPCNVIVRGLADGSVEVSAIDPVASMSAIDNAGLHEVAQTVQKMLSDVVSGL
ncbi:MAG TPA: DUF302 domain-containing protein [Devosia sp.]|nr:DUF302 domain-containing protein [Devosia sp.]